MSARSEQARSTFRTSSSPGGASTSPAGPPTSVRPFPFWVLQVAELVIAVILVDVSVHVGNGGLLIGAATSFAVLAVTARGPFGILRICPQRLHVALVVGASVLVAAAPIVPALRPDLEGIIVVEFAAVGVIRVATLTRTSDRPSGVAVGRRANRPEPVIDTTASVVEAGSPPEEPSRSGSAAESTARRAGRNAGAAAASGRRLWARHGPAVESGARRALRKTGRWVGKATGSSGGGPGATGE